MKRAPWLWMVMLVLVVLAAGCGAQGAQLNVGDVFRHQVTMDITQQWKLTGPPEMGELPELTLKMSVTGATEMKVAELGETTATFAFRLHDVKATTSMEPEVPGIAKPPAPEVPEATVQVKVDLHSGEVLGIEGALVEDQSLKSNLQQLIRASFAGLKALRSARGETWSVPVTLEFPLPGADATNLNITSTFKYVGESREGQVRVRELSEVSQAPIDLEFEALGTTAKMKGTLDGNSTAQVNRDDGLVQSLVARSVADTMTSIASPMGEVQLKLLTTVDAKLDRIPSVQQ